MASAEKWNVVAGWAAGVQSATATLGSAWEKVLFNQFHDILAGSSIREAYDDALDDYGEARAVAGRVQNKALHGGNQPMNTLVAILSFLSEIRQNRRNAGWFPFEIGVANARVQPGRTAGEPRDP
ncbi:MAG: hypothetical protein M1457_05750 [bacterium]|nr:hypothetical protein [bacterium]